MVSVICVLKLGGNYTVQDVTNLFSSVSRHAKDFNFLCFTDAHYSLFPTNIEVIPLVHNWPGWWSKLELFRHGVVTKFDKVWYFDLDTVIVDSLEPLFKEAAASSFLSDFYWPERIATGAMCWSGGSNHEVYTHFLQNAEAYMARFRKGGDQAFIGSSIGMAQPRLQDRFPGAFVSYKVHCKEGVPDDARVVCFHGKPKPKDIDLNTLLKQKE